MQSGFSLTSMDLMFALLFRFVSFSSWFSGCLVCKGKWIELCTRRCRADMKRLLHNGHWNGLISAKVKKKNTEKSGSIWVFITDRCDIVNALLNARFFGTS